MFSESNRPLYPPTDRFQVRFLLLTALSHANRISTSNKNQKGENI